MIPALLRHSSYSRLLPRRRAVALLPAVNGQLTWVGIPTTPIVRLEK